MHGAVSSWQATVQNERRIFYRTAEGRRRISEAEMGSITM